MIVHHADVTAITGVPYYTLRQWVKRDHLTRHSAGRFDLAEVYKRLATRDTRKDRYHRP